MTSVSTVRYRTDAGKTCIDIRLKTVHQLFDGRDPAPFRERELHEGAVEYILGATQDVPRKADVKIVFWIAEQPMLEVSPETVVEAVRAHFRYEIERFDRCLREHFRHAHFTLVIGVLALAGFLALSEATKLLPAGHVRQILLEGLVIMGWVAMWRPLQLLLYDWWPLVRQRRLCTRIVRAEIAFEHRESDETAAEPLAVTS